MFDNKISGLYTSGSLPKIMANLEIRPATTYNDGKERFDIFFPEGEGMMHGVQPTRTRIIQALFDGARRSELVKLHRADGHNPVPFPRFFGSLIDDLREAVNYRAYLLPEDESDDLFYKLEYDPNSSEKKRAQAANLLCLARDDRICISNCSRVSKLGYSIQKDKESIAVAEAKFIKDATEIILASIAAGMLHEIDRDPWELVSHLDSRFCYKFVFSSEIIKKRAKLGEDIAQYVVDELSPYVIKKEESTELFQKRIKALSGVHDARIRSALSEIGKLGSIQVFDKEGKIDPKRSGVNTEEIKQTLIWFFSGAAVSEAHGYAKKYLDIEALRNKENQAEQSIANAKNKAPKKAAKTTKDNTAENPTPGAE